MKSGARYCSALRSCLALNFISGIRSARSRSPRCQEAGGFAAPSSPQTTIGGAERCPNQVASRAQRGMRLFHHRREREGTHLRRIVAAGYESVRVHVRVRGGSADEIYDLVQARNAVRLGHGPGHPSRLPLRSERRRAHGPELVFARPREGFGAAALEHSKMSSDGGR